MSLLLLLGDGDIDIYTYKVCNQLSVCTPMSFRRRSKTSKSCIQCNKLTFMHG